MESPAFKLLRMLRWERVLRNPCLTAKFNGNKTAFQCVSGRSCTVCAPSVSGWVIALSEWLRRVCVAVWLIERFGKFQGRRANNGGGLCVEPPSPRAQKEMLQRALGVGTGYTCYLAASKRRDRRHSWKHSQLYKYTPTVCLCTGEYEYVYYVSTLSFCFFCISLHLSRKKPAWPCGM